MSVMQPPPFPVPGKPPRKDAIHLQALDEANESPLFRRRVVEGQDGASLHHNDHDDTAYDDYHDIDSTGMSLGGAVCSRCASGFAKDEEIVNSNGEVWHHHCFVEVKRNLVHQNEALLNKESTDTESAESLGGHESHDFDSSHHHDASTYDVCTKCGEGVSKNQQLVNYNGHLWHPACFVCAQCFNPFPEGVFYEFEGRKYCEHDFNMLFAPCCGRCNEFIIGRVIKAMNTNWHPNCFICELCNQCLADSGYFRNANRALCKECNERENAAGRGKYWCFKCHSVIEEGHLKHKGESYHPYHFNCSDCGTELASDAREKGGDLFCLRCYDKSGIPICGACRRPIDGERIVHALGKAWHVEHFVCAQCEKPFLGTRHYEKKGLAYCELHYHQLFGNICFVCNQIIAGDVFSALNKAWCVDHFACSVCDKKMGIKSKFYEFDLKPTCKGCYDKFPSELKRRLKKAYDQSPKK